MAFPAFEKLGAEATKIEIQYENNKKAVSTMSGQGTPEKFIMINVGGKYLASQTDEYYAKISYCSISDISDVSYSPASPDELQLTFTLIIGVKPNGFE